MDLINLIFIYFYNLVLTSINNLNWDVINFALTLLIILSIINLLNELLKILFSSEAIQNSLQKALQSHNELIENLRKDLFIERVRANFLAMTYFAIVGKNNEFELAKKQLLELGLDEKIVSNPNEFDAFFQKLVDKRITITFNPITKKFILEEKIINNNKEK